jgi:heme exporter protein B
VVGAFLASMSVFSQARELLLPVMFLPMILPNIISAAGAAYAVLGPQHDLADYRGYCLFSGVYAVTFCLVAYAVYDYILDD